MQALELLVVPLLVALLALVSVATHLIAVLILLRLVDRVPVGDARDGAGRPARFGLSSRRTPTDPLEDRERAHDFDEPVRLSRDEAERRVQALNERMAEELNTGLPDDEGEVVMDVGVPTGLPSTITRLVQPEPVESSP